MKLIIDQEYDSIKEAAEMNNVEPCTISNRIKNRTIDHAEQSMFFHYTPDLMNEIWKVHPTIPVDVSNCGRIRYFNGRIGNHSGKRYLKLRINEKHYMVHRLVAETFLPNPSSTKTFVHHKDHDKQNNCVENLEWVTHQENVQYFFEFKKSKK